jgi:hypothetical protein
VSQQMPNANDDRLVDMYDRINTHDDPHSPYYDGPDEDEEEEPANPLVQTSGLLGVGA